MTFKIKNNDEVLTLQVETLVDSILKKALLDIDDNVKLKNLDAMIDAINSSLKDLEVDITKRNLLSIYFLSGYYYNIFLNKNNVIFEQE